MSVTIPNEYGYLSLLSKHDSSCLTMRSYVLLTAAASTFFINTWHTILVGSARKAAKVPYPNAYASAAEAAESQDKYLFNCAQRAHYNFLEALPTYLVTLLVAGIRYPVLSAGLGVAWGVARVMYGLGYMRKDKKGGMGRYAGIWHSPILVILAGMSGLAGWGVVVGK